MRTVVAVVVVFALQLVAYHTPTYLEDLKRPALVWDQGNGLCSKIVAVDASGNVWTEQGCENGRPDLQRISTASQAQVESLWVMFEALPSISQQPLKRALVVTYTPSRDSTSKEPVEQPRAVPRPHTTTSRVYRMPSGHWLRPSSI